MADRSTSRIMVPRGPGSADAGRRRPTVEVETNVLRTMQLSLSRYGGPGPLKCITFGGGEGLRGSDPQFPANFTPPQLLIVIETEARSPRLSSHKQINWLRAS